MTKTDRKRSWYAENRERCKERARKWQEANPDRVRALRKEWEARNPDKLDRYANERRWRQLGLKQAKQELYNFLYAEQQGLCALCGDPPSRGKLVWDHSPMSGQPRGLLCHRCNIHVGWLERLLDDQRWAEQAHLYLDKWVPHDTAGS